MNITLKSFEIDLLKVRSLYFYHLFSFFQTSKSENKTITIEIPQQQFLNVKQCKDIILILLYKNKNTCYEFFKDISHESLVFFASYFQVDMIFKCIIKRAVSSPTSIGNLIKVMSVCQGEYDNYTVTLINIACDILSVTPSFIKDEMQSLTYLPKKKLLGQEYAVARLNKLIRDRCRMHVFCFSRYIIKCSQCSRDILLPKNYSRIVYTPCCLRITHLLCFLEMKIDSCLTPRSLKCNSCQCLWSCGRPQLLSSEFLNYQQNMSMQYIRKELCKITELKFSRSERSYYSIKDYLNSISLR